MADNVSKFKIYGVAGLLCLFLGAAIACADAAQKEAIDSLIAEGSKTVSQRVQKGPVERPVIEYTAEGMKDPFADFLPQKIERAEKEEVPESQIAAKLQALSVEGIVWGTKMPQAIVNNRVIKAGDMVDGARVIKIEKDGITFLVEDREYKIGPPSASGVSGGIR